MSLNRKPDGFISAKESPLRARLLQLAGLFFTLCTALHVEAYQIRLFPASVVYDPDVEILHERLGIKGQPLKVEDFEDAKLEDWLQTNLRAADGERTQTAWAGNRASADVDSAQFKLGLPNVQLFGIGLGDDGGDERVSINGGIPTSLKFLRGHEGNGSARAYYVIVETGPGDPPIVSIAFDRCFTVAFDHLVVLQERVPRTPERLFPRLVLDLMDGTRLAGHFDQLSIAVAVRGQRKDIAFHRILSIQFQKDANAATLLLRNGEKIAGDVDLTVLKLRTILGELSIPREKITRIKVSLRGEFKASRDMLSRQAKSQFHAEEPVFQGKPLRTWLSGLSPKFRFGNMMDLVLSPDADEKDAGQEAASHAIREIGSKAVPFLLEMLRKGEGNAMYGFEALGDLAKSALPDLLIMLDDPDEFDHSRVVWSIGHIGSAARIAMPSLLQELRLGYTPAADALGNIGRDAQEAAPIMIAMMEGGDRPWDIPFIVALGRIGSKKAIPILTEIALGIDARKKTGEPHFAVEIRRHRAVEALGRIGPEASEAVPMLLRLLEQQSPGSLSRSYFADRIIRALGGIGPEAKAALPLLQEMAQERDRVSGGPTKVAQSAAAAIEKITK